MKKLAFVLPFSVMFCLSTAFLPGKGSGPYQNTLQMIMERGKKVYAEQCLVCHMADGTGVPGMNPPLLKTKFVLGDKKILVQLVLKGMKGEVDIDGNTYHNVMAPHSELSDQQIADVLTFIRNSFGNKAKNITAAEVKQIRVNTK
jgi:mono/diheme cytochrome c family protein